MATRAQAAGYGMVWELRGFEEMKRALDQLPKAMSRTVLRNALKKSAKPVQALTQINAPRGQTGRLARSIEIGTKLKQKERTPRDRVTVYVGSTAPHAHLVEFGTVERTHRKPPGEHYQDKNGNWYTTLPAQSTGSVQGYPFMTRSWDATKAAALKILQGEVWNELCKAAARLAKKAQKGTLSIKTQRDVLSR